MTEAGTVVGGGWSSQLATTVAPTGPTNKLKAFSATSNQINVTAILMSLTNRFPHHRAPLIC